MNVQENPGKVAAILGLNRLSQLPNEPGVKRMLDIYVDNEPDILFIWKTEQGYELSDENCEYDETFETVEPAIEFVNGIKQVIDLVYLFDGINMEGEKLYGANNV